MRKLRLNAADLRVETFTVPGGHPAAGTVQGHDVQPLAFSTARPCTYWPYCHTALANCTINGTCVEDSCGCTGEAC